MCLTYFNNPNFLAISNSSDGLGPISQLFYAIILGDNNVLAAFEIAHLNYE